MRSDQTAETVVSFGPFRLYPAARLLERDGTPVDIGGRALDILILLAESAGEVVGKKDLVARVWADVTVDEGSLRFHVSALRKALGDGKLGARYVVNVPGRGYCLAVPIFRPVEPPAPGAKAPLTGHSRALPPRLASMVGRDETVRMVTEALSTHRFVTVVGPGGIGKTTVAMAAGRALSPAFDDQVWFVDLGPLGEPRLVPAVVASTLGLMVSSDDPVASLIASVQDKRLLLILDNCEHVIEPVAVLAETLFSAAPLVHILATSRESLRVEGEHTYRLFPLPCPPQGEALTVADVLGFPAAQLFIERATAAGGDVALTDADAPSVADICHRVDGIPLAIELAAARVDVFGVKELSARLEGRLLLTTRGRRTAMPRHQTLRATLDWSHDLLSEAERVLLRRLAVFVGSFSLDEAIAMACPELASDAVQNLLSLVAKSLVVPDGGNASSGYRLLETTRTYALEKLEESGEREELSRRHAEYYRGLLERVEAEWDSHPAADLRSDYGRQIYNVRAAMDWAFSPDGDALLGVALTTAAIPLWMHLSLVEECRSRVERAIAVLATAASVDARVEMKLQAALGASLLMTGGAISEIEVPWTRALRLAESLGDIDHQLRALLGLWLTSDREALSFARRFFAVASTSGDRLFGEFMIAVSSHWSGDLNTARHHLERVIDHDVGDDRSRRIIRFQGDQRLLSRAFFARTLWLQGSPEQAVHVVESVIEDARAAGHAILLCRSVAQAGCPIALWTGRLDLAERYIDLLTGVSTRQRLTLWRAFGRAYRGALLIRRGDFKGGLPLLRGVCDEFGAAIAGYRVVMFFGELAGALGLSGQLSEGLTTVDEAIERAERRAELWIIAELLRIKGELLAMTGAPGDVDKAEACFRQALDWAVRQNALSWELRTAMSLARLLRDHSRSADAVACLQPIYHRFAEGFETADLRAAKTILDDLC